jgi:hypothetical protein
VFDEVIIEALFRSYRLGTPESNVLYVPGAAPYFEPVTEKIGNIGEIEVFKDLVILPIDFPAKRENVIYVAPEIVCALFKERDDFYYPTKPYYAENGKIVCYGGIKRWMTS